MPHTEKCVRSEVTSMEEGRDVDAFERDELDRALKSALKTHVIVCADECLSVFTSYVGRLGNEQEAKDKEAHQASAMTAVASNKKALKCQSCDRIAKINGVTKAIGLLVKGMTRKVLAEW